MSALFRSLLVDGNALFFYVLKDLKDFGFQPV